MIQSTYSHQGHGVNRGYVSAVGLMPHQLRALLKRRIQRQYSHFPVWALTSGGSDPEDPGST